MSVRGNPSIHVIIVTYNGKKWIDSCLRSCLASSIPLTLIVVDNCSTDDTPQFIAAYYPSVHLINAPSNLGFGRANNLGIRFAISKGADFLCLLNQDAYLHTDTVKNLMAVFTEYGAYGVLSPMQLNGVGTAFDKNFEFNVFSKENCPHYAEDLANGQLKQVYSLNFIMAAIWLLRKEVIDRVGCFAPIFRHYGEDADYLSRVRYHGYQIGIVPAAVAYHDRALRHTDMYKQLQIDYIGKLSELTDINRNLVWRLASAFKFYFINLIGALSKRNFKLVFTNTRLFSKQLTLLPVIIKTRRKNRRIADGKC